MSPVEALAIASLLALSQGGLCYLVGRPVARLLAPNVAAGLQAGAALLIGSTFLGVELAALGAAHVGWTRLTLVGPALVWAWLARDQLWLALREDYAAARGFVLDLRGSPVCLGLALILVLTVTLYLTALTLRPLVGGDGLEHWLFKAKVFWVQQHVDLRQFVVGPDRLLDYPQGLPLAVDTVYTLGGGLSDHLGRMAYMPFVMSLVLTATSTFRRLASPPWALLLAVLLVGMPIFGPQLVSGAEMGYADFPLACAMFASAAALVNRRDGAALAMGCGLVAATLKLEGEFFAVGVLLVLGVAALRAPSSGGEGSRGLQALRSLPRGSVPCLVALLLVAVWWPLESQLVGLHSRVGSAAIVSNINGDPAHRLGTILIFTVSTLGIRFDAGWLVIALVLAAQLAILATTSKALKMVFAILLWQGLLYLASYMFTPFELVNLMSTTIYRLYIQVAPLIVLLLVLALEPSALLKRRLVR